MRDVEDLHVMQAIQEGLKGSVDGVMEIAQRNLSSVSLFANTCLQMLQWRYTRSKHFRVRSKYSGMRDTIEYRSTHLRAEQSSQVLLQWLDWT